VAERSVDGSSFSTKSSSPTFKWRAIAGLMLVILAVITESTWLWGVLFLLWAIPRPATIAATLFFVFMLWIVYLANTGSVSPFFYWVRALPYGDKVSHFGLFGTLTFMAIIASRYRTLSLKRVSLYTASLLIGAFALSEEISQAFIATRQFEIADLVADSMGIGVASLAAYALTRVSDKQALNQKT